MPLMVSMGKFNILFGINFFKKNDELFLAAYNEDEYGNINDPIGEVLLWSLSLKTRPEFNCFC